MPPEKIIKKITESDDFSPFFPTKHIITRWFNILNNILFDNKLIPFFKIEIRKRYNCGAELSIFEENKYKWSELCMNNSYPNFRIFLETLAHEMIHHWQWIINNDIKAKHNSDFFSWKEKFNKLNLRLTY